MIRVCFVCLGNICRSPTAEGVMRHLLRESGLDEKVEVDSAGTGGYHVGEQPDARARAAGQRRGIEIAGRARKVHVRDFDGFDYLLAMDRSNLEDLAEIAPKGHRAKLLLLREFDRESPRGASVPDPYYGGEEGFDEVIDLCVAACRGLIERIREEHAL